MSAREIRYPNIVVHNPEDETGFGWADLARTHADWLRFVCPQLGFDAKKLILAEVIDAITGDDGNAIPGWFKPEESAARQRNLFVRMDWERETPETPGDVKEKINLLKSRLSALNWQLETDYTIVIAPAKRNDHYYRT